jgi:HEAT repeat protein
VVEEGKLVQPILLVFKDQGDQLAAALTDADIEVRVLARRCLEMLGTSRQRLLRREESIPNPPGTAPKIGDKVATDPLFLAIKPGLLVIAKRAKDPDIRVRRATLDFLEAMEEAAAPAVPTLVAALADGDLYLRWQAARTLGKVGRIQTDLSVPALAKLLNAREDPDVREAAASTLRRYGPIAKAALPALIFAITLEDPLAREAAIRATISVAGAEATDAVPALRLALKAAQPSVRRAAAEALGIIGPGAVAAVDDLRQYLMDESAAVRTAASEALVNILTPREK